MKSNPPPCGREEAMWQITINSYLQVPADGQQPSLDFYQRTINKRGDKEAKTWKQRMTEMYLILQIRFHSKSNLIWFSDSLAYNSTIW